MDFKIINVEKEEDLKRAMEEDKSTNIILLGTPIPWKRNAKQIFLSYAEKMANLLPQESKNRLETKALSFFPPISNVFDGCIYYPDFLFGDKRLEDSIEPNDEDERTKEKYISNNTPYRDTYFGRIYTKMLESNNPIQENEQKTTGEKLIEISEKVIYSARFDIFNYARDISKEQNGTIDALRLLDWFNEFSSSFMAEIGKIACTKDKKYIDNLIGSILCLSEQIKDKDNVIKSLNNRLSEIKEKEEAKKKEENKTNEMVNKQPLWIKCLCGLNGNTQLLNYRFDSENNRLVFSLNKNCKNFGVLGQRIVDDSKELGEKGLDITKRGLETRLRELTDNLENVDIESPLETLAKKIRACSNK